MLKSEVYFLNHRWWFAIHELGRLMQPIDTPILRRCKNKKDATRQAGEALEHMKAKQKENQNAM